MQIDRHIAIWAGWVAGPAFGIAMMAAPEYFHLTALLAAVFFWGGIGVFGLTIIVLLVLACHEKERQRRIVGPIFTMALGAAVFLCGAAWYFWPAQGSTVSEIEAPPPIGSLRATNPIITFQAERINGAVTGRFAGQIKVTIHNDTDKLIFFHATTAGNINGVPFAVEKVQFDGYISARGTTDLLSSRIGVIPNKQENMEDPSFVGIFEYLLQYRYADSTTFTRESGQGIKFTRWKPVGPPKPQGTVEVENITVNFYNQTER